MSFGDAVRSVLTQYVGFSGRARRSEYWWFFLFSVLVSLAAAAVDAVLDTTVFGLVVALALFLPSLAVSVRRLHDIGRTGWWVLLGLVPLVGTIVLIVFACLDSEPGPNRFGPAPKQPIGGPGWGEQPPPAWS
ncbi:DUF805 domain-containing protein [Geodermatophilus sp. DSM 44513]|uniref:DUF805 domain-containing protein n=1 Tax=Geodermatophilus sp. DSM 44513 TaxID=1528104 RepID=UPI00127074AE|nr:DUF805 domain-containing protein [Geodermatophilus sp. DSM 44513]WNV76823.1 DUF805 domain-containing protein [Geodermatophilus sp. DSM 44513]